MGSVMVDCREETADIVALRGSSPVHHVTDVCVYNKNNNKSSDKYPHNKRCCSAASKTLARDHSEER